MTIPFTTKASVIFCQTIFLVCSLASHWYSVQEIGKEDRGIFIINKCLINYNVQARLLYLKVFLLLLHPIFTMLTDLFLHLVKQYSGDKELATNLWLEIFTKYSEPKRHYHTVAHLEAMVSELKEVRNSITDWDTTLLAVFYHDIVYKASSSSNEADSAKLMLEKLTQIGFPAERAAKCARMILATKQHEQSEDDDTNYLIDADLAILGANPEDYLRYSEQIRAEYAIFPDFMYNVGRRKALQHFLSMENIYKTEHFRAKYGKQAKANIENELSELA